MWRGEWGRARAPGAPDASSNSGDGRRDGPRPKTREPPPVDPSVCGFRDREKWNLPGQQFHAGVESWDELGPPDRGGGREDDHAVQTLHLLPGFEQRARVPSLDSLQLWGLGPHWWVGGSGPLRGAGPFS